MYEFQNKNVKFDFCGAQRSIRLVADRYQQNDRLAIRALGEDGPFGVLTVNIPEVPLLAHHVLIKTWNENQELAAAALATGCFIDTGMRVQTGFVEASVWKCIRME